MAIFGNYGGVPRGGLMTRPPVATSPQSSPYTLYNKSVEQQAGDYGNIMAGYKNLLDKGPSSASNAAVSNLGNLATTGGLSDEDVMNLRARGISPIRSIYSSANRDVDRQKAVQGGYSPNYGAVKAKMARELSDTLANKSTDVEAHIAEMRQKGRLSSAGQYASAANQQNDSMENALRGMTSLYGTTPALSSLYGGQALQGAQFQNQVNQQGQRNNLDMISRIMQGMR